MSQQMLLFKKDQEAQILRAQAHQLTRELDSVRQALRDREIQVARLNTTVAELRDAAIKRDLELTSTRQTLGVRDAESVSADVHQRSTIHTLQQDLQQMQQQLDEERSKRMALADDKNRLEHEQRQRLREVTAQLQAEQASQHQAAAREVKLQAQVEHLQQQLLSKCRDVDAAMDAASAMLEDNRQLRESQAHTAHAQEEYVQQLQSQVLLLSQSESVRSSEQQARLRTLITSFNNLRETCEQQAKDIDQLNADKRRLEEDKRRMRERLTEMASLASSLKADKDQADHELHQQVSRLHSTHMQLTIAEHKAREALLRSGADSPAAVFLTGSPPSGAFGLQATSLKSPTKADDSTQTVLRAQLALSRLRSSVGALGSPAASPAKVHALA